LGELCRTLLEKALSELMKIYVTTHQGSTSDRTGDKKKQGLEPGTGKRAGGFMKSLEGVVDAWSTGALTDERPARKPASLARDLGSHHLRLEKEAKVRRMPAPRYA
jgi:hypothetical protein